MKLAEYFVQGAWLGGPDEQAAFIGLDANLKLNRSLTSTEPYGQWSLMADKYLCGQVLEMHGFPVPMVKAAFAVERRFGRLPALVTADALAAWLSDPDHLPAFAKPVDGSMSLGSVPLFAAGAGQLDVGGRVVDASALAAEVAGLFPRGWLVQELLQQPAEIEALIGPGIGSVRVVTLWEADGPQLMYGVWRHPAPGTWVDAAIHGSPNVGCGIDGDGRLTSALQGDLLYGKEITHSLVTPELPLVGTRLDQWPAMVAICREAHRTFPGQALIGWDIAMTTRGPVISEVNANPLHLSYQRAFRRGFLHQEHRVRLDAARRLMQERTGTGPRKKARR
jgi:Sugar-transfer associated ATP-grasp